MEIDGRQCHRVGLGCMGMSFSYAPDRHSDDPVAVLAAAFGETGPAPARMIDTAAVYGPFVNEDLIGRALRLPGRSRPLVATKVGLVATGEGNAVRIDGRPDHLRTAVEASLGRLGVERIDLLYLHRIDPGVPLEESWGALADLVAVGKVAALGLSEVDVEQLDQAHRVHPVAAVQSELSLFRRRQLDAVLPWCESRGAAFVAYAPLGRGLLTGTIGPEATFGGDDFRHRLPVFAPDALRDNQGLLEQVRSIARSHTAEPGQVALAWLLAQSPTIVAIPGTRRLDRLRQNIAAERLVLTGDDLTALSQVPEPSQPRYPPEAGACTVTEMSYRLLGRSGLRVSDLALGTMLFGATTGWGVDPATARQLYEVYREAGGNYLDTANQYANGESERIIADLVAGHRHEIVIASKYTNAAPRNGDANVGGNQRKNMVQSVEESLRRLGTDHLDVYVLHSWDQLTPVEEVVRGLDDLVSAGKVLYTGISNTPAWVVAKANTMAELRGWTRYVGLQIEYSLLGRSAEAEFLPMAADQGLSVLAWSPLKNGLLTGKYADGGGTGSRLSTEVWNSRAMAWADPHGATARPVIDAVRALASDLDATPAQVSLAWLRYRSIHVVPILGATSVAQLRDNIDSLAVTLTPAQVQQLDEVSDVPLSYPHPYLESQMSRSFRSGGLSDRISR